MIFIETPTFEADREEHFSDETFAEFQQWLADRPDAGALIRGGHGLRKIRIAQPGRGKSGGGRVIYYWRTAENQILLVAEEREGEPDTSRGKGPGQVICRVGQQQAE